MESYRSGHNEAVLKTVWAHAHVGSNPTLSAKKETPVRESLFLAESVAVKRHIIRFAQFF